MIEEVVPEASVDTNLVLLVLLALMTAENVQNLDPKNAEDVIPKLLWATSFLLFVSIYPILLYLEPYQ